MNEDTLGYTVCLTFSLLFVILPAFIARKALLKSRAAKEQARLENQPQGTLGKPSLPPQPASPQRAMVIFSGAALLVAVSGLMTGFAVGMVSNLIYIVFLFPLALGISSGMLIAEAVKRAKIRRTWQLVFLSVLSAVSIYGTFHYSRYIGFQVRASLEIFSGLDEALDAKNLQVTKAVLDYALQEETGQTGFPGYMLYRASEGVSIGRLSRSSGFHLGPVLTWLYWLLEFTIILGVTLQKGRKLVRTAFCESCGNLQGGEKHLGGTIAANEALVLDLIRQKDFIELGKLMEANAELPSLEVYFQGCEVCGGRRSELVVRHAFQGAKGLLQFQDAERAILQPAESAGLLKQWSFSGD